MLDRLLDREVPGSIPSQGARHTKDVIKMVPVVPLFYQLSMGDRHVVTK